MNLNKRYRSKRVINLSVSTFTMNEKAHDGKIITLDLVTGVTVTLPPSTGNGAKYTFVIKTAATSNAHVIKVANSKDVMNGSLNIQQDDDSDGTLKCWMAEVADDTMTFAGAATTGGITGNRIECVDYAEGYFSCTAWTISSGGSEATPFSASV